MTKNESGERKGHGGGGIGSRTGRTGTAPQIGGALPGVTAFFPFSGTLSYKG